MDAHMAPTGGVSARVEEETLANLVRCMLWATVTLATLIACWLLFRRLGGAFAQPLGWAHLLTTAVILSATAALTRICGTLFVQSQTSNWGYWLLLGLLSVAVLLVSASVSLPGSSTWALIVFWLVILAEEITSFIILFRKSWPYSRATDIWRRASSRVQKDRVDPQECPSQKTGLDETDIVGRTAEERSVVVSPSARVLQQLTRVSEEDGSDLLFGTLRGEFSARQRSSSLHVAFCPPMDTVPELKVQQTEGVPVDIRPAQVFPYGVRLDLRISAIDDRSQSVLLEIEVRARQ